MRKRPLSAFPSQQRQCSAFRAAALLCLGLVGGGSVMAQQVGARRHSAAKPPVKAATDNDMQAVSLKAGQRLSLGVFDPHGSIRPGGAWRADYGAMTGRGLYTAPRFTPPEGLDEVQYTDSNGSDVFFNVRVLPNPTIPNSDRTPTVTFDYLTGNPTAPTQPAPDQTSRTGQPAGAASASDGSFTPTGKTIVVLPGETPAPAQRIVTTASLEGETVHGTWVLVLPAITGGGEATSALYARPLDETPQRVTVSPFDIVRPVGPVPTARRPHAGTKTP